MLDRGLARRTAALLSGGAPEAAVPADLAALCTDAERRIVAYTGLTPAAPLPAPEAVGRPAWIAANVDASADLLDPLVERAAGQASTGPLGGLVRGAAGAVLGIEAGALTGYLSQRVLGQYELALTDPARPARLLFVAPNIGQAVGRLRAGPSDDVWAWIAVHEVTHAVQFAGVPWLREHIAGLVSELLDGVELAIDPAALLRPPRREASSSKVDLRDMAGALRSGGIAAVVARGERGALLDRLQATMAVVEGHAEHVMDAVGADVVGSLPALRAAMDRRRSERPPALRLLERLIGLEAKLRQYEDGRRFCDALVAGGGHAALVSLFAAPDRLPSPTELADPAAWLRRCGSVAAV